MPVPAAPARDPAGSGTYAAVGFSYGERSVFTSFYILTTPAFCPMYSYGHIEEHDECCDLLMQVMASSTQTSMLRQQPLQLLKPQLVRVETTWSH